MRSPSADVTREHLLRALEGTCPPADPARVALAGLCQPPPEALLQRLAAPAQPAAVLLPLVQRHAGLSVLFVVKAPGLKHHAGQIGFPGGRIEAADQGPVQAALREAREEIALPERLVEVAGFLPAQRTLSTDFAITPVVGLVDGAFAPVPDASEVVAAFEVPLAFFLNRANASPARRVVLGVELEVVEFQYDGRRIWGATAAMLASLTACLAGLPPGGGDR